MSANSATVRRAAAYGGPGVVGFPTVPADA